MSHVKLFEKINSERAIDGCKISRLEYTYQFLLELDKHVGTIYDALLLDLTFKSVIRKQLSLLSYIVLLTGLRIGNSTKGLFKIIEFLNFFIFNTIFIIYNRIISVKN